MSVLNKEEIERMIKEEKLISDFINLENQLTPNGIDITLKEVYKIKGSGSLDFSNKERNFPDFEKIELTENGWWKLEKGVYKIKANEHFKMPLDLIALANPRSSLMRMGATVFTGVWDAGFEGKVEFLLNVLNDDGINLKENCKIIQVVFFKMNETKKGYDGIHKHLK